MKGFMIAGATSDSGKTTVTFGILSALKSMNKEVQSYKVGPDYIDPMYHTKILNRPCINLDSYLLKDKEVKDVFAKYRENSDIVVLEGVMGLFDGVACKGVRASSADVANLLDIPIILVVDARKASLSIAATIHGFMTFREDVKIAGVILNRVSSKGLYLYLKELIESHINIDILGYFLEDEKLKIPSRHLGLYQADEISVLDDIIINAKNQALENLEWDKLLLLESKFDYLKRSIVENKSKSIKLAIAKDEAFSFYYEDNIRLLEEKGIELVPFSPLHDEYIPNDIDGIYIGGGYPEVYAKELSKNTTMKESIKKAADNNMPMYCECGGFMYLTKSIEEYRMVGVFDFKSILTKKLVRFGYINIKANKNQLLLDKGEEIKGHSFHYSDMTDIDEKLCTSVATKASNESLKYNTLYQVRKVLGGYPHIMFRSNQKVIDNWIKEMRIFKNIRTCFYNNL